MHASQTRPGYSTVDIVVAVICGFVGANALLGFLFFGGTMMLSALSSDPHSDPHGYSIVFGFLFGVPCAIVAAFTLPAVFPPALRARAYAVSGVLFAAVMAVGYVAIELSR